MSRTMLNRRMMFWVGRKHLDLEIKQEYQVHLRPTNVNWLFNLSINSKSLPQHDQRAEES